MSVISLTQAPGISQVLPHSETIEYNGKVYPVLRTENSSTIKINAGAAIFSYQQKYNSKNGIDEVMLIKKYRGDKEIYSNENYLKTVSSVDEENLGYGEIPYSMNPFRKEVVDKIKVDANGNPFDYDLDYKPIPWGKAEVIEQNGGEGDLHETEWLAMRKNGIFYDKPWHPQFLPYTIGGSTYASVLGVSPWASPLETFYQKKAGFEMAYPDEFNEEAKAVGHLFEDIVATKLASLPEFKNWVVWNDPTLYQHPKYPHTIVNLDRRLTDPSGVEGGLEIKTTDSQNFQAINNWKNGIVPIYYLIQTHVYMSVTNLPFWYIVCSWGNAKSNEMAWVRVDRDLRVEKIIMDAGVQFIDKCHKGEKPTIEGIPANVVDKGLWLALGATPSEEELDIIKADSYHLKKLVSQYADLSEELKEYRRMSNEIQRNYQDGMKELEVKIRYALDGKDGVQLKTPEGRIIITHTLKERRHFDRARLLKDHPEIHDKYYGSKKYGSFEVQVNTRDNRKE